MVSGYRGELMMQPPGARLVFTDSRRGGLTFDGATGAGLYGLTTAFVSRPTSGLATNLSVTQSTSRGVAVVDQRMTSRDLVIDNPSGLSYKRI